MLKMSQDSIRQTLVLIQESKEHPMIDKVTIRDNQSVTLTESKEVSTLEYLRHKLNKSKFTIRDRMTYLLNNDYITEDFARCYRRQRTVTWIYKPTQKGLLALSEKELAGVVNANA